jgi:hypothetical protein
MAATFYAEPVLTFDLDIFVLLPSQAGAVLTLTPLYEDLRRRGYAEEGECVTIEGVPVQFLPAYNALIEEAVSQACDTPYEQTPTRVLRAEHLIAIARPGEGPTGGSAAADGGTALASARTPYPGVAGGRDAAPPGAMTAVRRCHPRFGMALSPIRPRGA